MIYTSEMIRTCHFTFKFHVPLGCTWYPPNVPLVLKVIINHFRVNWLASYALTTRQSLTVVLIVRVRVYALNMFNTYETTQATVTSTTMISQTLMSLTKGNFLTENISRTTQEVVTSVTTESSKSLDFTNTMSEIGTTKGQILPPLTQTRTSNLKKNTFFSEITLKIKLPSVGMKKS